MTPEHAEAYARHLETNPPRTGRKHRAVDPRDIRPGGRTKPSGPRAEPRDLRGE